MIYRIVVYLDFFLPRKNSCTVTPNPNYQPTPPLHILLEINKLTLLCSAFHGKL